MASEVGGYRPEGPLDPVAAAVAEAFSAMPLQAYPIELTRAGMKDAAAPTREPALYGVDDHRVPVKGGEIAVRLYRPVVEVPATIAWAHGGGFALGSIEELDNFCRLFSARTGCAVASIEYRLAPEHKFPTAVEDVEAAVLWLAGKADGPLWLGGDSAGGNLAAVVTRRLHAAGRTKIAGNVLVYPCVDGPEAESLRRFDPPFLGPDDVVWFFDMYLPDAASRADPDFAPILAADLSGLPPTLVLTAEHDILTEQGEAYAARLADSGVDVEVERAPGMIHGYLTLDPFLSGAATVAIDRIGTFIAAHP